MRYVCGDNRPMLKLHEVSKHFGGLVAVDGLSFDVYPGRILGLIGPNGAGKTTVFNLISGISPVTSGRIEFLGRNITPLKPYAIARLGMARTFQEIHLFKGLSVLENVRAAGYMATDYSLFGAFCPFGKVRVQEKKLTQHAMELLARFGLESFTTYRADDLPYGLQKRLEIVKALITKPKLVLLDEPAAGLNTDETIELMKLIDQVRSEYDLTVLIIEHAMEVIQGVCDHVIVVNFGQKLAEGTWDTIHRDQEVIRCYLGED